MDCDGFDWTIPVDVCINPNIIQVTSKTLPNLFMQLLHFTVCAVSSSILSPIIVNSSPTHEACFVSV